MAEITAAALAGISALSSRTSIEITGASFSCALLFVKISIFIREKEGITRGVVECYLSGTKI
ncbi:MAG TPA: hypothetical protein DEA85_07935 [Firmicutes bacterium]|nr:hypothetical protein [Bacillota bacterium]HBS93933.1 hypothetical protein [Bacillota bacterium]